MTERHLSIAEPAPISSEQIRELRAIGNKFGLPLVDEPIDYRAVQLNAAHAGCIEEAAAELRRQGFLLLPSMLERVVAKYNAAGVEVGPDCSRGGQGVCTVCVLAQIEAERYPDGAA